MPTKVQNDDAQARLELVPSGDEVLFGNGAQVNYTIWPTDPDTIRITGVVTAPLRNGLYAIYGDMKSTMPGRHYCGVKVDGLKWTHTKGGVMLLEASLKQLTEWYHDGNLGQLRLIITALEMERCDPCQGSQVSMTELFCDG